MKSITANCNEENHPETMLPHYLTDKRMNVNNGGYCLNYVIFISTKAKTGSKTIAAGRSKAITPSAGEAVIESGWIIQ